MNIFPFLFVQLGFSTLLVRMFLVGRNDPFWGNIIDLSNFPFRHSLRYSCFSSAYTHLLRLSINDGRAFLQTRLDEYHRGLVFISYTLPNDPICILLLGNSFFNLIHPLGPFGCVISVPLVCNRNVFSSSASGCSFFFMFSLPTCWSEYLSLFWNVLFYLNCWVRFRYLLSLSLPSLTFFSEGCYFFQLYCLSSLLLSFLSLSILLSSQLIWIQNFPSLRPGHWSYELSVHQWPMTLGFNPRSSHT